MAIKTTQRIDRLSNYKLELGLKNSAILTVNNQVLSFSGISDLVWDSVPEYDSLKSDNSLAVKKHLVTLLGKANKYTDDIFNGYLLAGTRIAISQADDTSDSSTAKKATFSLSAAYQNTDNFGTNSGVSNGSKAGWFSGQSNVSNLINTLGSGEAHSGNFITGIQVDEFGAVTGVTFKKVIASDIDNTNAAYDNYRSWRLSVGSNSLDVASTYQKNGDAETQGTSLTLSGDSALNLALDASTKTLGLNLKINSDFLQIVDGVGLQHKIIGEGFASNTASLVKIKYDNAGHITGASAVVKDDLSDLVGAYSDTNNLGLVSNSGTETANLDTEFYTKTGKWAKIPYSAVAITNLTAKSKLLATTGTDITSITTSTAQIDSSGNIEATSFKGDGSAITNLNASNISSGTLNADRLPTITTDKISGLSSSSSGILVNNGTSLSTINVPEGTANTNLVLAIKGTSSPSFLDINTIIDDHLGSTDAMIYKGTIGTSNSTISITSGSSLKAAIGTYQTGHVWKANTEFSFKDQDGQTYKVEIGDTIIANLDSSDTSNNRHFSVLQTNIDGAVTSADGGSDNDLTFFSGSRSVKKIDGVRYETVSEGTDVFGSLTVNAQSASKLRKAVNIWGASFDGSKSIDSTTTANINTILPTTNGTGEIGSESNKYSTIWANEFKGNLTGNADTATTANKVANKLKIGENEYDGSSEVIINLGNLGGISGVSITSDNSTGNVITGITETITAESSVKSFTFSKTTINGLSSLIFDLFNVNDSSSDKTNRAITITPASSYTSGKIYLSNNILGYGGSFEADKLYVRKDSSTKAEVLTKTTLANASTQTTNNILVAKFDEDNKTYGYEISNIQIESSTSTTFDDSHVLTSGATNTLIDNKISAESQSTIKTKVFILSGASASQTLTIPANSIVRRIVCSVDEGKASSAGGALNVGPTNDYWMKNNVDVNIAEAGIYIVDMYKVLTAETEISVIHGDAGTSFSGAVIVDYSAI